MGKQDLEQLRRKYQERQEQVEKRSNGGGGGGNSDFLKNFLQLKEGNNPVRFLPGIDGKLFYAETFIHQIEQNGNKKNIHCLRVHNETCPLCELYFNLFKTEKGGGDHYKPLAKTIKRRQRFYANVIDRNTGEVKILSYGEKLNDSLLANIFNEDWQVIDPETKEEDSLLNPRTGYDYIIKKNTVKGPDGNSFPNYDGSQPRPKASPVAASEAEINALLAKRHDIYALVRKEKYEDIKQIAESIISSKAPTVTIFGRPANVVTDTESEEVEA